MLNRRTTNNGFILIFAIWVLTLLVILAVSVASSIRQKIIMAKTLDERSRLHYLLEAALVQTTAYVMQQMAQAQSMYTVSFKSNVHDNPSVFSDISLGEDHAQAMYTTYDLGVAATRFGIQDEERKINLNTTDMVTLSRLLVGVLGLKLEEAGRLAQNILDWRQVGDSQASGFFSDEYYSNLQYPYPKKNANYETLDELLLVKGISGPIYERLLPYVTVYGDGKININTASVEVLSALGLSDEVIGKVISVRRGRDGFDGTLDDHVFARTFDVATEVNQAIKLEPAEAREIDGLNLQGKLTVNSYYFSVDVQAYLAHSKRVGHAHAVFSTVQNHVLYWKEK